MVCLAPRAPGDSVRPRRSSGVVVRPLNFTVRPLWMNAPTKAAAHGSLFSLPAAMLVTYWAWGLFPTMTARLAGYALFVILLAPVASISALAIWWHSSRRGSRPKTAMIIGTVAGIAAFYLEAVALYFFYPQLFGKPFSAANLFPGLVTGAIVAYARSGVNLAKRGKAV